jgi:hypothetical protein
MKDEKQDMILVPAVWLEGLQELANEYAEAHDKAENAVKTAILSARLTGYAMSASTILKHNERVKK